MATGTVGSGGSLSQVLVQLFRFQFDITYLDKQRHNVHNNRQTNREYSSNL